MKTIQYLSRQELQSVDRYAAEVIGVPSIVLMENAGIRAAQYITAYFPEASRILIICGHGNNAGDGFVIARQLHSQYLDVRVLLIGDAQRMTYDAAENFRTVRSLGIPVSANSEEIALRLGEYEVIIDAVYGIGFRGELPEQVKMLFRGVNVLPRHIGRVAIDIPSGMEADSGIYDTDVFRAHLTVSMHAAKKGFLRDESRNCTGEVRVVSIGIPAELHLKEGAYPDGA